MTGTAVGDTAEDDNPLYLFETDMDDNAHIRRSWWLKGQIAIRSL